MRIQVYLCHATTAISNDATCPNKKIIAAVVGCFKDELPKILADIQLSDGVQQDDSGAFLNNVMYIRYPWHIF